MGFDKVLFVPPYLMGFLHYQHVIHGPFVCHSWKPRVNLAHLSMRISLHILVHLNRALHHDIAPLAILLYWTFHQDRLWWASISKLKVHKPLMSISKISSKFLTNWQQFQYFLMMKSFLHLDLDGLPFCAMNITLRICLDIAYFVKN